MVHRELLERMVQVGLVALTVQVVHQEQVGLVVLTVQVVHREQVVRVVALEPQVHQGLAVQMVLQELVVLMELQELRELRELRERMVQVGLAVVQEHQVQVVHQEQVSLQLQTHHYQEY